MLDLAARLPRLASGSPGVRPLGRDEASSRRWCAAVLGSVRIVAGSRKGAKIFAPKGLDTRPTGDRVREAVFNLVGPVDGASVLDLYAGSGAMGLEALSRGAASAVFVESDRDACAHDQAQSGQAGPRGRRGHLHATSSASWPRSAAAST